MFPIPHWTGPLTSRSGFSPPAPGGSGAPPEWWRRQAGPAWFGDWLYVMPARAVAAALRTGWSTSGRRNEKLFTLAGSRPHGRVPDWASLFGQAPLHRPLKWAPAKRANGRSVSCSISLGGNAVRYGTDASKRW
ncbi:hypothetical protein [Amycolatopsis plumensis]|uniref:hypothetical protein n=1 Tax=Amycolatopsis plumensis TaxID=236508 RepID=UPI0036087895